MGYRIENYSLNELHRISVSGAVVPAVFWVLPVGKWSKYELERLWRWFTEQPSHCRDYGLLLVKDHGRRKEQASEVSLASVGAKLADVMPTGAERFISPSAFKEDCPKALVLSGAYPQPGWGVLIEWPENESHFESLVRKVIDQLSQTDFRNLLSVFEDASNNYHRMQKLRNQPDEPAKFDGALQDIENAVTALREADSSLEADDYPQSRKGIDEAVARIRRNEWATIPEDDLERLIKTQRSLTNAGAILAVPENAFANEIAPTLLPLVAERSKREDAFKALSTDTAKNALSASLSLLDEEVTNEKSIREWAETNLPKFIQELRRQIISIIDLLKARTIVRRGESAQAVRDHKVAMERWRREAGEARENFHRSISRATELQWHLGPQFLMTFQDVSRERHLWVRSIPWDPARMIGWKLLVRGLRLDFRDLEMASNELSANVPSLLGGNDRFGDLADGSYFTDYVHHIALSRPGFSPRTVTCDLVARLVRPGEMINLIEKESVQLPAQVDAPCLADTLLTSLGWHAEDQVGEQPLAGCVTLNSRGAEALKQGISGNDLRIVLESFCKDLLDALIAELGYRHDDIWAVINERAPKYQPKSKRRDWDEEVGKITAGSAVLLFYVFAPLAFPAKEVEVKGFIDSLTTLSQSLNVMSHHSPYKAAEPGEFSELVVQVRELLRATESVFGELPWHLAASFVYGDQPKVISGEAWSHGCDTSRLLRVIVWTGAIPGPQVMLWNKTRRNPVISDPVFIVRPHR